jgi:hypothetical protein
MANAFDSFDKWPLRTAWLLSSLVVASCRNSAHDGAPLAAAPTAVSSTAAGVAASSSASSQAGPMEREQLFIESLRAITTTAQEDALAKQEVESARTIPRLAANLWARAEPDLAQNAHGFLTEIGDLAIVPVIEGPSRGDPKSVVQALNLITDAELGLRQKVIQRVNQLLDDKRPIPPRPQLGPKPEQADHPRRVCDEAYVAMRRLVHFGESQYGSVVEVSFFFSASEATRDQAIAEARRSNNWRRAVKPSDDDGESEDSSGPLGPPRH